MRRATVAVAGLGTVGREVARLLAGRGRRDALAAELELTAVSDRAAASEARALGLPAAVRRFADPLAMERAAPADIVVELLGGDGAPRSLALSVLRRGAALVTANKLLLSRAWPALSRAAESGGGRLAFEGAVAGGVPVLRALDISLAGDKILSLDAILNGTTNYILSRCEEGLAPDAALEEAQRLGLAERDPRLDLSGRDAAQKLTVLAALVAGATPKPGSFPVAGIERVSARDAAFARERLGCAVRLIASLTLDGESAAASVGPVLVPLNHPLAAVRRQYNALLVRAESAGDLMFYGRGAGAGPTASAVLGDALACARRLDAAPLGRATAGALKTAEEKPSGWYLRVELGDKPGALARAAGALAREDVSISAIHQDRGRGATVPVMIATHPAPRARFERARRAILAQPGVSARHCAMRMLS